MNHSFAPLVGDSRVRMKRSEETDLRRTKMHRDYSIGAPFRQTKAGSAFGVQRARKRSPIVRRLGIESPGYMDRPSKLKSLSQNRLPLDTSRSDRDYSGSDGTCQSVLSRTEPANPSYPERNLSIRLIPNGTCQSVLSRTEPANPSYPERNLPIRLIPSSSLRRTYRGTDWPLLR